MKTVEGVLGLKIDYYALIDFYAFEQFIDELGFIEIDVPRNIWVDPIDGPTVKLKRGAHDLPGNLALAYARARNTEGGDFDRAGRQMQVIMAIRDRILSYDLLATLMSRAPGIYEQLSAGVQTNLGLDQAIQLAWLVQQIPEEDIKTGSIGTDHVTFGKSPDGDDVLKPRPEQIRILRDEIFATAGLASPALAGADPQELMQAENANVSVNPEGRDFCHSWICEPSPGRGGPARTDAGRKCECLRAEWGWCSWTGDPHFRRPALQNTWPPRV